MKVVHDLDRTFFYPSGSRTPLRVQDGQIHGGHQTLTADEAIDLAACLLTAAAIAAPSRAWDSQDGVPLPDSLFARLTVDTWRRCNGLPKTATSGLVRILTSELNQRSSICHALNKCLGNLSAALAGRISHAGSNDVPF